MPPTPTRAAQCSTTFLPPSTHVRTSRNGAQRGIDRGSNAVKRATKKLRIRH